MPPVEIVSVCLSVRVCVIHNGCPFIVDAQQCLEVQKWSGESNQIAQVSLECPSADCLTAQTEAAVLLEGGTREQP